MALGTVANRQAGWRDQPGRRLRHLPVVGTAVTRVCATEVARTGLNEDEARRRLRRSTTVVRNDQPATSPSGAADHGEDAGRARQRPLLAPIVGEDGAVKRIDVLATALHDGHDRGGDDPPGPLLRSAVLPLWDPVLIAARKAAARGRGGRDPCVKLVTAVIKPFKLDEVKAALQGNGVPG